MTNSSKQSSSIFSRCFRIHNTIPRSTSKSCPLSSVVEAIETIDQLVQTTEVHSNKQQGDFYDLRKSTSKEQIEEMLIKWTQIARFLIDAYQQVAIEKN